MRLEDVRFAIRPRSILECLDITFLFCGRHWVGLFLSAIIGVGPIVLLNQFIDTDLINGYGGYLILVMEIPWATMFVTLYLGQITFSRRFSSRKMIRDALRAVPQMLAFQFVIRGLCMVIAILCPVVYIGMYFLNEIILLEKPPITKTWHRRTTMNTRILARILSLRLMDLGVLFGGTLGLASLFRALTSLWSDKTDTLREMMIDPESFLDFLLVPDWPLQAAFWTVIIFLTVFRFVAYLDCRIRREGWDVELKLRAQAEIYQRREAMV